MTEALLNRTAASPVVGSSTRRAAADEPGRSPVAPELVAPVPGDLWPGRLHRAGDMTTLTDDSSSSGSEGAAEGHAKAVEAAGVTVPTERMNGNSAGFLAVIAMDRISGGARTSLPNATLEP